MLKRIEPQKLRRNLDAIHASSDSLSKEFSREPNVLEHVGNFFKGAATGGASNAETLQLKHEVASLTYRTELALKELAQYEEQAYQANDELVKLKGENARLNGQMKAHSEVTLALHAHQQSKLQSKRNGLSLRGLFASNTQPSPSLDTTLSHYVLPQIPHSIAPPANVTLNNYNTTNKSSSGNNIKLNLGEGAAQTAIKAGAGLLTNPKNFSIAASAAAQIYQIKRQTTRPK